MNDEPYAQPSKVTDLQIAFPADLGALLPPMDAIPEEFRTGSAPWDAFARGWFYEGFPKAGVLRKDGVDAEMAYRHLSVLIGSYEPKHEHKMAAVAWLASRWFAGVADETGGSIE
ncbi:hypothetical protein ACFVU2_19420 [Leifsonia sp. NPDC058194]|uniref:hypothetical protein n=1 Tax=Leifsonia sp. NPDC058194 TaxID=3346374 RepID=UPI0036DF45ED